MRHGLERVNVQAAVGLIENGIFRLEHRQLQNLGALLFAAGKTFVDRTRSERTIHPEQLDLFVKLCVIIGGLVLRLPADAIASRHEESWRSSRLEFRSDTGRP